MTNIASLPTITIETFDKRLSKFHIASNSLFNVNLETIYGNLAIGRSCFHFRHMVAVIAEKRMHLCNFQMLYKHIYSSDFEAVDRSSIYR